MKQCAASLWIPSFGNQFARVRINGSHFAICETFLRFCKANFIQKDKNAKLMKILHGCIFFYNSPPPPQGGGKESKALRAREENQRRVKKKGRGKGRRRKRGKGRRRKRGKGGKRKKNKSTSLLMKKEKI